MAVELKPLGNSCNLGCTYCYQEPMRQSGNVRATNKYDLDLMMEIADKSGESLKNGYTLFGGEALLLPKKDLEKVFKASYEKYKGSSVQTNGTLIDNDHIEMFKKYNVYVGVSFDGPNELNSLRVPLSKKQSVSELTNKTIENLQLLSRNNIPVGIIVTLHKMNGTKEQLPRLMNFMRWLGDIGIKGGNIHLMEVDTPEGRMHSLNENENEYAFLQLAKFLDLPENQDLQYLPFTEMELMQNSDNETAGCVWKSCDPLNTESVFGIEGNGQLSNCGMVNKEGIEWTKATGDQNGLRDFILYQTPQEHGGCKDCPFFIMCNGYCPGSAMSDDWRNRSYHCKTLKSLFGYYEEKLVGQNKIPFSQRPDRKELEDEFFYQKYNFNNKFYVKDLERLSLDRKKAKVNVKAY